MGRSHSRRRHQSAVENALGQRSPRAPSQSRMSSSTALPGGEALNLEHRLSYRFSVLSAKMRRAVYIPEYGVLPSNWRAMAAIGRYGPMSGSDVCVHTTVEPDKVTRAVHALMKLNYVRREQDQFDKRRIVLSLTPLGRKVYNEIERATRQMELLLSDALTQREREMLHRVLKKLEQRADEHMTDKRTARDDGHRMANSSGPMLSNSPAPGTTLSTDTTKAKHPGPTARSRR